MKAMARMGLKPQADPNVIPFIDVLLVLLVIFMVTAPMPTVDLRFDAARAGEGAPPPAQPTLITLTHGAAGALIFVNGEPVAIETLADRVIVHALRDNPTLTNANVLREARVYVSADLDIAYEQVVDVMSALYGAHFSRIAVLSQDADAV